MNITELSDKHLEQVSGGMINPDHFESEYLVRLEDCGTSKISIMRELAALLGLSLSEAKLLADSAPVTICTTHSKEEAILIKAALEDCGAKVSILEKAI